MGIVKNIRYGLATNSSSTHSIIHIASENVKNREWHSAEFGWNFFTLASKEAKREYMMEQYLSNVREARSIISVYDSMFGCEKTDKILDGIVDHQSVIPLPVRYNSKIPHEEFFLEYVDYIVNNTFVIFGGNDNDDICHPDLGLPIGDLESFTDILFRSDDPLVAFKNGNYWLLFNKFGSKYRISFESSDLEPDFPELIDLKITDYCDMGCPFCYQGSTENGKHASMESIKNAVGPYFNPERRIEFAVGGGEPTSHPEFAKILHELSFYGKNIVNFTTRSTKWFGDDKKVEAVKKYVSGVAYSVSTVEEVIEFKRLHKEHLGNMVAMYIHIIPELLGETKTKEIVWSVSGINREEEDGVKISITMLGYKSVGRGEDIHPGKIPGIIKLIKSSTGVNIGIDTKMAQDYQEELDTEGVDKKLYTKVEGEFSMYYDAVEEKVYTSSYTLDDPIEVIDESRPRWQKRKRLEELFSEVRNKRS